MLEKKIKYKDEITGEEMETTAWFNITKAEAMEFNIRQDLVVIGASRDQNQIMDTFNRLLSTAYGLQTADRKFVKTNIHGQRLFEEFRTTEAYSELFMEIFSDKEYALEFIKAVLPKEVVEAEEARSQGKVPDSLQNHPSMQGYQAKKQPETRREAREQAPAVGSNDWDRDNEETRKPEERAAVDPEYAEYLAWKNSRGADVPQQFQAPIVPTTPPDRVSPPEALQTGSDSPRNELI